MQGDEITGYRLNDLSQPETAARNPGGQPQPEFATSNRSRAPIERFHRRDQMVNRSHAAGQPHRTRLELEFDPSASRAIFEPTMAPRPLSHFAEARAIPQPTERLKASIYAAHSLREELLGAKPVRYYRSIDLIRVPYPTRYAFRDTGARGWMPFIHIVNRLFVIQFESYESTGRLKTLLVSPSDAIGNRETPFFKALASQAKIIGPAREKLLAPTLNTVESALAKCGISPEQVDYITYDHLHTQDLRKWLGQGRSPGYFPNAKLLVSRTEWLSAQALLPTHAQWYCPNGTQGIAPERIELFDEDLLLGEGVALIRTPGHTQGNHSIVVRTPEGIFVTSENGVGPDAYSPKHSALPALRRYNKETGIDVVLNGNTLESSVDQYISMRIEKELAGPSRRNPDFPNLISSSEFSPYWLFPGLSPTFCFGEMEFGTPMGARL